MAARPGSLPMSSTKSSRRAVLQGSMVLVIALVAGLACWDEQRESRAALDDFAAEQSTLASSLAAGLSLPYALPQYVKEITPQEAAGK